MRLFSAAALTFAVALTVPSEQLRSQTAANAPAPPPPSDCSQAAGQIVVCGRRGSDKYRIAPQFRPQEERPADARRAAIDPRLECRNVGPRGCGTELVPIITVAGDGSVRVGDDR